MPVVWSRVCSMSSTPKFCVPSHQERDAHSRYSQTKTGRESRRVARLNHSKTVGGRRKRALAQSKREHGIDWPRFKKELESGEHPCKVCGETDITQLQIDHIVPLFQGGKEEYDNYQSLCQKHHKKKTAQELANSNLPGAEQAKRVRAIKSKKGMAWWKYGKRKQRGSISSS